MNGSRFIVRHVDVSVAGIGTIWRWRGWATNEDDHPLRDHRTLDVYLNGSPEAQRVVGFHEPISSGLMQALGKLEWAVAEVANGAQTAARPALGALASARRGTYRAPGWRSERARRNDTARRSTRPAQPARLNRLLIDVTQVWEGATVRLAITRRNVELQVRSTEGMRAGDLPPQLQKALRFAGETALAAANAELQRAARVIAGCIPSYDLAREIEQEHDDRHGFVDRPSPSGIATWEHALERVVLGSGLGPSSDTSVPSWQ